jgi:hypothetical protein
MSSCQYTHTYIYNRKRNWRYHDIVSEREREAERERERERGREREREALLRRAQLSLKEKHKTHEEQHGIDMTEYIYI